jgi:type I restriction enzyme M protein
LKNFNHWWQNRKESDQVWKIKVEDLKDWDLDIKNPHSEVAQREHLSSTDILDKLLDSQNQIIETIQLLKNELI